MTNSGVIRMSEIMGCSYKAVMSLICGRIDDPFCMIPYNWIKYRYPEISQATRYFAPYSYAYNSSRDLLTRIFRLTEEEVSSLWKIESFVRDVEITEPASNDDAGLSTFVRANLYESELEVA